MIQKFRKQYVQVITKTTLTEELATESGISLVHAPIAEEGIFVHSDEDFIYLGTSPKTITTAIAMSNISSIKIVEQPNNPVALPSKKEDGEYH